MTQANPVYAGYAAYKRRERVNGRYRRLDSGDWIKAEQPDESIRIIDEEMWAQVQKKRKSRADQYLKASDHKNVTVIKRNDGLLPLIDVIYCGYCKRKMTNGTKYSYWKIRDSGEKRASKIPIYRCQTAQSGAPHNKTAQLRADLVEKAVFDCIEKYIERLQREEDIFDKIKGCRNRERKEQEAERKRLIKELAKMEQEIEAMEGYLPKAATGEYVLSMEELAGAIRRHKEKRTAQQALIQEKEEAWNLAGVTGREGEEWKKSGKELPTWGQLFREADRAVQRVLVNLLIERIDVTKEQAVIYFIINQEDFLPRISGDSPTP